MLNVQKWAKNVATIHGSYEEVDKAVELINLFSGVELDTIKSMLSSDAGKLALAVLQNECNSIPVRELIDELLNTYLSADTERKFIPRTALIAELDDVLACKSITPYRRSRINKALKRECIQCYGSGKKVRVVEGGRQLFGGRKIKHEISRLSPDCMHCKGTGINPKEVERNGSTVFDLEQLGSAVNEANFELGLPIPLDSEEPT